jgi:hypothetical protein
MTLEILYSSINFITEEKTHARLETYKDKLVSEVMLKEEEEKK